jgi:hypothetical protein
MCAEIFNEFEKVNEVQTVGWSGVVARTAGHTRPANVHSRIPRINVC